MKKFLIIILCCVLNVSAYSQKLNMNKTDESGRLVISTVPKYFKLAKPGYMFGMGAYIANGSVEWYLQITSLSVIPESSEALFRLGNDEVMHLTCKDVKIDKWNTGGFSMGLPGSNMSIISPTQSHDLYISEFPLNREDLEKISQWGIKKIRVSSGTDFKDTIFSNNALGKYLIKCWNKIQKEIGKKSDNKGIYDGF